MKQTPRYVRLAFFGFSVLTLALAKAYEQHLWLDFDLLGHESILPLYLSVTRLTIALTALTLALFAWLFTAQKVD